MICCAFVYVQAEGKEGTSSLEVLAERLQEAISETVCMTGQIPSFTPLTSLPGYLILFHLSALAVGPAQLHLLSVFFLYLAMAGTMSVVCMKSQSVSACPANA